MPSQTGRTGKNPIRLLALATILQIAAAGAAFAQTIMIRNAPPGGTIEVVVNAETAATATVDPGGEARLAINLAESTGKTEIDANVFVDVCTDNLRRVVVVERGQPAAPQPAGCDRRDTGALFLVRRVSTLIVDVGGTVPSLILRQGPVRLGPPRIRRPPRGLVVFGGGGLSQGRDTELMACGNLTECSADQSGLGYQAGATVWFTRILGAEVAYVRPADSTAEGGSEGFTFDTALDAHVLTIAGKVGIPARAVRLYGHGGATYHRATFTTEQTTGELSQTFLLRTAGWGWMFGGGLEVWAAPAFGIYGEFGRAALKGTSRDDAEGSIDDRLTFLFVGVRIRIAGR